MIRVWDAARLLGAAIAELPLSAESAAGPAGAFAVVDGAMAAHAAARDGALGFVVVAPDRMPPEDIATLAAASGALPVVVVRRRLRAQQPAPAAAVVAECSAPPAELAAVLRDTVGWIRELTGGPLTVEKVVSTGAGSLALLTMPDGAPATVLARPLSGVPVGGVIRVSALAVERREVDVDEPAGVLQLRLEREGESVVTTGGYESAERAALRRLGAGELSNDLADLQHDAEIARRILDAEE